MTIFLLIIDDIGYCVTPPIQSFEFADDRTIYLKDNDLEALEAEMQQVADQIVEGAETKYFRFSTEKIKLIHFTRRRPRRKLLMKPIIMMHGERVAQVKTHKILGLISHGHMDAPHPIH